MLITACENCDGVTAESRKGHPARWTCIHFPRLEGFSPVAPRAWVDAEPYMKCSGINGGHCPMYRPRRDGQKEML